MPHLEILEVAARFFALWRVAKTLLSWICVCRKIGSTSICLSMFIIIFPHFPIFSPIEMAMNWYLYGIPFEWTPFVKKMDHPHFVSRSPSLQDSETASESNSSGSASTQRQYVRLRSLDPWAIKKKNWGWGFYKMYQTFSGKASVWIHAYANNM